MTDGVVMTPVVEILRNVRESYDYGPIEKYPGATPDEMRTAFWGHMLSAVAQDSGFGHLVESIQREGFTGSAIGWNPIRGEITEGHHRLTAAILLCLDAIPTTPRGTNSDRGQLDPKTPCTPHCWGCNYSDPYPILIDA